MSFFSWFFGLSDDKTEHHVLCPFPHQLPNGMEYYESNPSAQVNLEKRVFHCKACDRGFSQASFIMEVLGCNRVTAEHLIPQFQGNESLHQWDTIVARSVTYPIPLASDFKISEQVQRDLKLTTLTGVDLRFPVTLFGKLLDVRTYTPTNTPKCVSQIGAVNGLIVPHHLWADDNRWTLLCAGEKDMAVARSHGFNAIYLTGGETMCPTTPKLFKGKKVAILYDNDETGIYGAHKVGNAIAPYAEQVKVVTAFHEGMQVKEDLTDYFNKYGHSRDDLIQILESTPVYIPQTVDLTREKFVNLHEASQPKNLNRVLYANIQVVATSEAMYTMPSEMVATKTSISDDPKANTMTLHQTLTWEWHEENAESMLHLVDNNFKEKQLLDNRRKLINVPFTERNVSIKSYNNLTIYKATVTDMYETSSDADTMPVEYAAYSVGKRLESGKKYRAKFKIVPHPYNGQQLTMIIIDIEDASDCITSFRWTPETQRILNKFTALTQSLGVSGMVEHCSEAVKGLLGYNGNNLLIKTIDLAYHTPLQFNLGNFTNERAYLDTLIVGESRMGKSSTADKLRKTYGLGTFVSLAGTSATIAGLIGGSNKVNGGMQTKAGIIPQNHKGLMILEEFGKCKTDVISELTDIRSSNQVRITRVSSSLTLPAMVRMITLSNVKTLPSKEIRSIASYPHGVAIITELVGAAEDIARYDIMLVIGDKGNSLSDPYWQPLEPFTEEEYRTRIQWVWSRTPEQIIISEELGHYIFEQANALNKDYDSHIKIFGTEAWKKLARIAIATAGYTVSSDTEGNLIVLKEHIDYAVSYLREIYDNSTFRLKEYVDHERKFITTDEEAKTILSNLFQIAPGAVLHLEQEHKTNKQMLAAAAGLAQDRINSVVNQLITGMFIKLSGNDIIPTERFRLTLPHIQRRGITNANHTAVTILDGGSTSGY